MHSVFLCIIFVFQHLKGCLLLCTDTVQLSTEMHLALTLTGGPNLEGRKADSILSNGPFTLVDTKTPLLKPNLPKFSLGYPVQQQSLMIP